jgi:hypothetical protein
MPAGAARSVATGAPDAASTGAWETVRYRRCGADGDEGAARDDDGVGEHVRAQLDFDGHPVLCWMSGRSHTMSELHIDLDGTATRPKAGGGTERAMLDPRMIEDRST